MCCPGFFRQHLQNEALKKRAREALERAECISIHDRLDEAEVYQLADEDVPVLARALLDCLDRNKRLTLALINQNRRSAS